METTTPPQNQTPAPTAPAITTLITAPSNPPRPRDRICWQSQDGKVVIRMRVKTAKRHPPHDYPVIIVECHPNPFERIRHLPGGGVEAMFSHAEVKALLEALVEADHKVSYTMTTAAARHLWLPKQSSAGWPKTSKSSFARSSSPRPAPRRAATR